MSKIYNYENAEYNIGLIADIFAEIFDGEQLFIPIYREPIKIKYKNVDTEEDTGLPTVIMETDIIDRDEISALSIDFLSGYLSREFINRLNMSPYIEEHGFQYELSFDLLPNDKYHIEILISSR